MREAEIRPAALFDEFLALLKQDAERLAARRVEFVAVPCPFCASPNSTPAFRKDDFEYRSCSACESLYASPRPSATALIHFATTSEAARFWSSHFYKQTADARREKMFRPRAALVARLLRTGVLQGSGTIVDIGAGYGLFLQEVQATGAFGRIIGVEPDHRMAAVCRELGCDVIEKWVEDIADGEIQADVATSFEVLEHVFEPSTFLRSCARALRPGGTLLFTTLAVSGFDLQVLWQRSRSISPPQHINFPTVRGARELIWRSGLDVLEISTPGELDVDIVRNVLLTTPDFRSEAPRFIRSLADWDDATRADFQAFLRSHQFSSHLRCIARKPR